MYSSDLSSIVTFSDSAINVSLFFISSADILLKSYLWQREIIVSGTL
jgi:hypothetical protein